jgi:hypothetical protein
LWEIDGRFFSIIRFNVLDNWGSDARACKLEKEERGEVEIWKFNKSYDLPSCSTLRVIWVYLLRFWKIVARLINFDKIKGNSLSGFGGLGVSVLPSDTQVRGFKPG